MSKKSQNSTKHASLTQQAEEKQANTNNEPTTSSIVTQAQQQNRELTADELAIIDTQFEQGNNKEQGIPMSTPTIVDATDIMKAVSQQANTEVTQSQVTEQGIEATEVNNGNTEVNGESVSQAALSEQEAKELAEKHAAEIALLATVPVIDLLKAYINNNLSDLPSALVDTDTLKKLFADYAAIESAKSTLPTETALKAEIAKFDVYAGEFDLGETVNRLKLEIDGFNLKLTTAASAGFDADILELIAAGAKAKIAELQATIDSLNANSPVGRLWTLTVGAYLLNTMPKSVKVNRVSTPRKSSGLLIENKTDVLSFNFTTNRNQRGYTDKLVIEPSVTGFFYRPDHPKVIASGLLVPEGQIAGFTESGQHVGNFSQSSSKGKLMGDFICRVRNLPTDPWASRISDCGIAAFAKTGLVEPIELKAADLFTKAADMVGTRADTDPNNNGK